MQLRIDHQRSGDDFNIFTREYLDIPLFYWVTFSLFATALILVLWLVDPAPPKAITFATGREAGFYDNLGRRFKDALEQQGLAVSLRPTKGSVENIRLLKTDEEVSVGFVQGGVVGVDTSQQSQLRSLATLAIEPVWIFAKDAERLVDLERRGNRKIAIGPLGSGTRDLSLKLFSLDGISQRNLLIEIGGHAAADKLLADEIDAVVYVSTLKTPWVQRLLREPSVFFVKSAYSKSLVRIFPFLSEVFIPARTLDFEQKIPPEDITLIGAATNLVVREELHPAVKDLLLQTAKGLKLGDRLLGTFGQFPKPDHVEYQLDDEAKRFFEHGPTFIRRYFPFWVSNLVERFWILIVPVITILIPLLGFGPPLLQWQMRRRIYRWYKDLRHLEAVALSASSKSEKNVLLKHVEDLERQVSEVRVPLPYRDELYRLRVHVEFVRKKLV